MQENPVIVIGAGPVGLVTALSLAQNGIPVRVFEAERGPVEDQRGAAFHPPTLEMLSSLGIVDELKPLGVVVPVWQIRDRDEGVIASFDLSVLADETPFPYRFHLGQHLIIPVLLKRLCAYSHASVHFSCRAMAVRQDSDSVTVTVESPTGFECHKGNWLVGADGGRSTIRKDAGIAFDGYTWPEHFVVNNLTSDIEALGLALTNYVTTPDSWAVVLKLSEIEEAPLWRVTYPIEGQEVDEAALNNTTIERRFVEFLPGLGEHVVRHTAIYRVHQRVAQTFRRGRILLAGDAAHINNPLGGFGLNSGIHDAFSLSRKLISIWRGESRDDALDRYVAERRHANLAYIQASSIRNKKVLEERDPASRRAAHEELRRIADIPELTKRYLMNSSMISSIRDAARFA